MKRRRKKQKKNFAVRRFASLLLVALAMPLAVNWLVRNGAHLTSTGEKAAMIAAAANMPEEGLDLIRERFAQQLYQAESEEANTSALPPEDVPPPFLLHEPLVPLRPESERSEASSNPSSDTPSATPKIPSQYRAPLLSENFAVSGGTNLVPFGAGLVKNDTRLSDEEVSKILETPMQLRFVDTDEPQVLIVHTHATEAFERYDSTYYDTRNTWRSRDNNMNMVSVGAAMAEVLESNGIGVIHDTTQHDYPSYNGSYEKSAATIQQYLDEYPSIKIVLDLHRDAMERENQSIIKPVTVIDDKKAAQVMIIAACDDTGALGVPEYRQNLRFAAALQSYTASSYKDLTRPVFFCYRKYNMDLSPGSLLIEFGSNANTLDEAIYAAQMVGQALSDLIIDHME